MVFHHFSQLKQENRFGHLPQKVFKALTYLNKHLSLALFFYFLEHYGPFCRNMYSGSSHYTSSYSTILQCTIIRWSKMFHIALFFIIYVPSDSHCTVSHYNTFFTNQKLCIAGTLCSGTVRADMNKKNNICVPRHMY